MGCQIWEMRGHVTSFEDSSASSPKKSPFFSRRDTSSAEPTLVHLTSPERIR